MARTAADAPSRERFSLRSDGSARALATAALVLVLSSLVPGLFPDPAGAAVRWEVLESSQELLRVRVVSEGAEVVPVPGGPDGTPGSWVEVLLPGASAVGEPGYPLLPRTARWLVTPPRGEVTLDVVSMQVEELGRGRVLPYPRASFGPELRDEGTEDVRVQRARLIESHEEAADYATFSRGRTDVVRLDRPAFQKRQRMAALQVDPVLHDAATGRLQLVREVEFVVRFAAGETLGSEPGEADPTVTSTVLNPEQAAGWRTLSPRLREKRDRWQENQTSVPAQGSLGRRVPGVQVFDTSVLLADPIRLRVPTTGIVRLRVDDLLDDHGLPAGTPRRQLRLVQLRGSDPQSAAYPRPLVAGVPLHFLGQPDEALAVSSSDEIFFHAVGPQEDNVERVIDGDTWPRAMPQRADHYNTDNVYFLVVAEPAAEGWERFAVESAPPSTDQDPATQFRRRDVFTDDTGYQDDPRDLQTERYHWNRYTETDVRRPIELYHPVEGQLIDVRWTAGAYRPVQSVDITFSVLQGDNEVDLFTQRLTPSGQLTDWSDRFSTDDIGHGRVTFRMNRDLNGQSLPVFSFLGRVELEYDALYRATNDRIDFELPTASDDYDLEVPGFSRDDLLLFDVTDPRRPVVVTLDTDNVVETPDSPFLDYTMSVRLGQEVGERRRFEAAPRIRFERVGTEKMQRDPVADLFEAVDDLQVLAVGPGLFADEMQRWVDFRQERLGGRDWNVDYVDVQQIYDQFSGGLQSPWAIRAFAEWAYLQWDARALMLVGDANEDARGASPTAGPNLVPISLHIQTFDTNSRELLGSDKWYAIFDYTGNAYPDGLSTTSDMLVGRLPVGDLDQLGRMLDKIIAYEQPGNGDDWRRRTLWMADDPYSTSYLGNESGDCYTFSSVEVRFATSQRQTANLTSASLDSTVSARVYDLDEFTRFCRATEIPGDCENRAQVNQCFSQTYQGELISLLSQGWLIVSYQGHADFNVLGHESILTSNSFNDATPRNEGRPFLFFGMGCHVADFLQSVEEDPVFGPSISERMLWSRNRGAMAVYGSSGFEYLTPNAVFMEEIGRTFFGQARSSSTVLGGDLRSRWVMGEVLAQAELNVFAFNVFLEDEMVAQYNLLGDPLQRMDAAPPRLTVERDGSPLPSGSTLVADPGVGTARLGLTAVDEAGIARVEIVDSEGRDYASVVPVLGGADARQAVLDVDLPIQPQSYTVEVAVYDQSYPDLRRSVLEFEVPLGVELFADGEPVSDPASFRLEEGRRSGLTLEIESPVDIGADEIEVRMENVDLTGEQVSGAGRNWTVEVDAEPRPSVQPGPLTLVLRGVETVLGEEGDPGNGGVTLAVRRHAVIPNPMRNRTHVTAEVEGPVDRVRLTVYDLAGHSVFERVFDPLALVDDFNGAGGRALAFQWDGRDHRGDELANGTYLYRLEVSGAGASARSEMGRLVIMR